MANTDTKPLEWHIYNELVEAVREAGVQDIFLENRSKKMDGVSEFVTISLPAPLYNVFVGNEDTMKRTSGVFYLGTKAKSDNTPNIGSQTDLVSRIKGIFPIDKEHIVATKPLVQFIGDDGSSFQITEISFYLKTKFNSHLK